MCRNIFIGQIEDRKADARAEAKSTIRPTLVEELTKSGPPGPPEAPDQHVPPEAPATVAISAQAIADMPLSLATFRDQATLW